jgi:Phosphotransferase enzyme family
MTDCLQLYPDLQTLRAGLASIFHTGGFNLGGIITREPNPYSSTFPTEIVRCALNSSAATALLCKYEAGRTEAGELYRRGLHYECAVYEKILRPLNAGGPRFYGSYTDPDSGEYWLVMEYLDGAVRVSSTVWDPHPLVLASRWLGRFHAATQRLLANGGDASKFLLTYDPSHYIEPLEGTIEFGKKVTGDYSWLPAVCERFRQLIPLLLGGPYCVIHGEYYPANVLFRKGEVYPVDWQSAAIAAGEIDLAILTTNWKPELIKECEEEYCRARWPKGSPANFHRRLAAARLYWPMTFIGAKNQCISYDWRLGFLEHLETTARELDLI